MNTTSEISNMQPSADDREESLINEKLKASEMRYRRLFESAKDGILILDFETGNIVDANPFILTIIDYPLEEILGKKLWEIGLFSNKEQSELAFTELQTNGYIRFEDMPIVRKNGKITEVEFVSNVYMEGNVKVIQCNVRDITERKIIEDALFQYEKLLSKTQEIAHIGSYHYNLITGEIKWSNEMYNIFGVQKEAFNLTLASFIDCIHTDDRSAMLNWIELTKNDIDAGDLDFRVLKPDKTVRNLLGTGILQLENEGKSRKIMGSIQDITIRKTIEKELIESERYLNEQNMRFISLNKEYLTLNEKLINSLKHVQQINTELIAAKVKADESDMLKTAFLANMSHEIRTPMNAILGFSSFLLEPDLSKEKISDFVRIINASSQQLMSVISDIIDISKIEAGMININMETVSVNNLMSEIYTTYREVVELKNLCLYYSSGTSDDIVQVNSDGNRIKQVLCNLLNNAIKFTQAGKIEFGFNIKTDFIEFYVTDTGMGIAPADQTLIFERFRQIAKSDSQIYNGNGLGLSISKSLVEKMGGTLTVDSALGLGSTFVFTIPYQKGQQNSVSGSVLTVPQVAVKRWKEKTILIVEDERINHYYLEEALSNSMVKILHAWDGREAVELVKRHPEISMVLMDIKMPVMNGFEATKLIKLMRPELPIVAQTAYSLEQDRAEILQSGFDHYLSKPISKEMLIETIASYLN
jgi:PAS domain S-box-containing protein